MRLLNRPSAGEPRRIGAFFGVVGVAGATPRRLKDPLPPLRGGQISLGSRHGCDQPRQQKGKNRRRADRPAGDSFLLWEPQRRHLFLYESFLGFRKVL